MLESTLLVLLSLPYHCRSPFLLHILLLLLLLVLRLLDYAVVIVPGLLLLLLHQYQLPPVDSLDSVQFLPSVDFYSVHVVIFA